MNGKSQSDLSTEHLSKIFPKFKIVGGFRKVMGNEDNTKPVYIVLFLQSLN